jgi:hypothetical protein
MKVPTADRFHRDEAGDGERSSINEAAKQTPETSFGPEKKRETGTTYIPDNLQQTADSLVGNLQCGEQERVSLAAE